MAVKIRRIEYYNAAVKDVPGAAYRMLEDLASEEVNLLAFNCVPVGPEYTQLILFPENPNRLARVAEKTRCTMTGPQRAFLIQGDDQLGALRDIHRRLSDAKINVYASNGVTDGKGGYGYILFVRPEQYEAAARVLDV